MTGLRKQFLQDLQLAGLAERTCEAYVRAVGRLAQHFRQSTDTLTEAQVRNFFSHIKNTIYLHLNSHSPVSLDEVRALVAAEHAAPHDPIAGVSRSPDLSPTSASTTVTVPTCADCGHRLRLVQILFHRMNCHDTG